MNFKLVNKVVYRICEPTPQTVAEILGVSVSDFFAEGNLGLWKAYMTFKPKKVKWSTYAATCIQNEINYFMRKANIYKNHLDSTIKLERIRIDVFAEDEELSEERKKQWELITAAHDALTDKQKQLFQLCYERGMPLSVAKDMMGISQPACSYLHTRMIKTIKKEVAKQLGG